jgi:hypothetical protein
MIATFHDVHGGPAWQLVPVFLEQLQVTERIAIALQEQGGGVQVRPVVDAELVRLAGWVERIAVQQHPGAGSPSATAIVATRPP